MTLSRPNFAIQAVQLANDVSDLSFSVKLSDTGTINDDSLMTTAQPTGSINLPGELIQNLTNRSARVLFGTFVNDALFQPQTGIERTITVDGIVVQADIFIGFSKQVVANLRMPIELTFERRSSDDSTPRCAFWDAQTRGVCIHLAPISYLPFIPQSCIYFHRVVS